MSGSAKPQNAHLNWHMEIRHECWVFDSNRKEVPDRKLEVLRKGAAVSSVNGQCDRRETSCCALEGRRPVMGWVSDLPRELLRRAMDHAFKHPLRGTCLDRTNLLRTLIAAAALCVGTTAARAAVTVTAASVSGTAGQTVAVNVTLGVSAGEMVAGTQNDITPGTGLSIAAKANGRPDCTANSAIGKESTTFGFLPSGCSGSICTGVRVLVFSLSNTTAIPDGSLLYTCNVTAAADATGTIPLTSSSVTCSDPNKNDVACTGVNGAVMLGRGGIFGQGFGGTMLTEEERIRIRAEEVFRLEIRRELEARKPHPSRREQLWLLLNSSFALWFLSSVVLTGLGAAFASHRTRQIAQARRVEIKRRLDTEISNRIAEALTGSRTNAGRIEQGQPYSPRDIYTDTVGYLDNFFITNPSNPRDFSIYPDYRNRGFRSLIFELSTVVDSSELPDLREALEGYEQLADLADLGDKAGGGNATGKNESLKAATRSMELLASRVMKDRWRSRM